MSRTYILKFWLQGTLKVVNMTFGITHIPNYIPMMQMDSQFKIFIAFYGKFGKSKPLTDLFDGVFLIRNQ